MNPLSSDPAVSRITQWCKSQTQQPSIGERAISYFTTGKDLNPLSRNKSIYEQALWVFSEFEEHLQHLLKSATENYKKYTAHSFNSQCQQDALKISYNVQNRFLSTLQKVTLHVHQAIQALPNLERTYLLSVLKEKEIISRFLLLNECTDSPPCKLKAQFRNFLHTPYIVEVWAASSLKAKTEGELHSFTQFSLSDFKKLYLNSLFDPDGQIDHLLLVDRNRKFKRLLRQECESFEPPASTIALLEILEPFFCVITPVEYTVVSTSGIKVIKERIVRIDQSKMYAFQIKTKCYSLLCDILPIELEKEGPVSEKEKETLGTFLNRRDQLELAECRFLEGCIPNSKPFFEQKMREV